MNAWRPRRRRRRPAYRRWGRPAGSRLKRVFVLILSVLGLIFLVRESHLPVKDLASSWGERAIRIGHGFREVLTGTKAIPVLGFPALDAVPSKDFADMIWPLEGRVTVGFGWAPQPGTTRERFHEGVDIEVPEGTIILAALGGRVVEAGDSRVFGKHVLIEHDQEVSTFYGHCKDVWVSRSQQVERGHPIASVGCPQGGVPHLHFEVRVGGIPVDPSRWMEGGNGP